MRHPLVPRVCQPVVSKIGRAPISPAASSPLGSGARRPPAPAARPAVRVTTLGVEFLRDVAGECEVADFPLRGETVTLEWQQRSQNFVITDVECRRGRPPASSIQLGNHHPPGRLSSALNMSMTADLAA